MKIMIGFPYFGKLKKLFVYQFWLWKENSCSSRQKLNKLELNSFLEWRILLFSHLKKKKNKISIHCWKTNFKIDSFQNKAKVKLKKLDHVKVIWMVRMGVQIQIEFLPNHSTFIFFYFFYSDILRFDCLVAEYFVKYVWKGWSWFYLLFYVCTKMEKFVSVDPKFPFQSSSLSSSPI